MSGISQGVIFCVNQLRVTFCDAIGNTKEILGTGFWFQSDDKRNIFITNKHNLDPRLKLGEETTFKLKKVEIQSRKMIGKEVTSETKFQEVKNFKKVIRLHKTADVGALIEPDSEGDDTEFYFLNIIKQKDLADLSFFEDSVSLMDIGSFIGFPGQGKSQWWDQKYNLGVARLLNIASFPTIEFTHPDTITSNTLLVSGLSFAGSSGSPVILHEKRIDCGADVTDSLYIPPRIIGIMSGHWQEEGCIPHMFQHSGLSYLTRSDSIIELIE